MEVRAISVNGRTYRDQRHLFLDRETGQRVMMNDAS